MIVIKNTGIDDVVLVESVDLERPDCEILGGGWTADFKPGDEYCITDVPIGLTLSIERKKHD